ncbi:hypothetical protein BDV11DRAFT_212750 [Aspergillus similis]
MNQSFVKTTWEGWQKLYEEPFRGITADGEVNPNLFCLRNENAPIHAMQEAGQSLVTVANENSLSDKMRYPVEEDEWRRWMNPEFYLAQCGIRLEEQPKEVTAVVLRLIECSLSSRGYQKTIDCMRIDGFFGDLIGASHLMNEGSYNFILFGEPSVTGPSGWPLWGHHLSLCCFALKDQMVVSPLFFWCEPNQIDIGRHAGTEMFSLEMQLTVRLMQSLSEESRGKAILYDQLEHPDMPNGMNDVKAHLDDTWLLWMGKYTDDDPFHFRINSPVLICEFDHECGMYLSNSKPGRFHIHTVVRTPNGNDYAKELLRLWKEKNYSHAGVKGSEIF